MESFMKENIYFLYWMTTNISRKELFYINYYTLPGSLLFVTLLFFPL